MTHGVTEKNPGSPSSNARGGNNTAEITSWPSSVCSGRTDLSCVALTRTVVHAQKNAAARHRKSPVSAVRSTSPPRRSQNASTTPANASTSPAKRAVFSLSPGTSQWAPAATKNGAVYRSSVARAAPVRASPSTRARKRRPARNTAPSRPAASGSGSSWRKSAPSRTSRSRKARCGMR